MAPFRFSRRTFIKQAGAALVLAHLPMVRHVPVLALRAAPPVVAIDAGHGGRETGAVLAVGGRRLLLESEINLDVALRLASLLSEAEAIPVLTREHDAQVAPRGVDLTGDGRIDNNDDLQARVDAANDAHADLFFSVHHNGGPPSVRGTAAFYCRHHPLGPQARTLAQMLQQEFLDAMRQLGYRARDLGALDDAMLNKPGGHLFLAGPATARVARASQMPTVVGEPLFVTNRVEGDLLRRDDTRQAIAEAYFRAALRFMDRPLHISATARHRKAYSGRLRGKAYNWSYPRTVEAFIR